MANSRPRTIVYVDGLNLYYGALKGTAHKWLDLQRLFQVLRNADEVVEIKYFTTRAASEHSRKDQLTYLHALSMLPLVTIIEGRFKMKRIECRVHNCHHHEKAFLRPEEKQTDVNIAVQLMQDAYEDKCDQFVVVSGDSDFVPALRTIKQKFPLKKFIVYVPAEHPDRSYATELRGASDTHRELPLVLLGRCQLPSHIPDGTGGTIEKPVDW